MDKPESRMPGELRQLMRYRKNLQQGRGRFVLTQALMHSTDRQSALSALSELSESEPNGKAMNAFRLEAVLSGNPLAPEDLSDEQAAWLAEDQAVRDMLYEEGMLSHRLYTQGV